MKRVIIPAKGTSLRLPKKNLRKIGDWALFQYVVNAGLSSQADAVWVSTDDNEVEKLTDNLKLFEDERLFVHRRTTPVELAPETGVAEIARQLIIQENITSLEDDYTVIILANCPEIRSDEIDTAFSVLEHGECKEVRSYKSSRMISLHENGLWGMVTSRLFHDEPHFLSTYVDGILSNATEIHTEDDLNWVTNSMTIHKTIHYD